MIQVWLLSKVPDFLMGNLEISLQETLEVRVTPSERRGAHFHFAVPGNSHYPLPVDSC
jgi:hypothetical protein